MGFDFDATAEDIKVFLDEAEELLQSMEAGILRLETESDDPEVIQEIFRAAHTLKGSSATLGHQRMAQLTHAMENVLDKVRKGKLEPSSDLVDTLFACLDVLKAFKDEIASNEESDVSTAEILAQLAAIDKSSGAAAPALPAAAAASPAVTQPAGMPSLTPAEVQQVMSARELGKTVGFAQMLIAPDSPMPAVRAFQVLVAAGEMGQLVASWPTQDEVEADKVGADIKILFITDDSLEAARAVLEAVPETKLGALTAVDLGSPAQIAAAAAPTAPAPTAPTPTAPTPTAPPKAKAETPNGKARESNGKSSSRTVRVDVEVLDNLMSLVGELVIERTRLLQVQTELETERDGDELSQVMASALAQIGRMTGNLQEEIQRARMLPVDNLFRKFPRMVRDVAHRANKEIEFVVQGEETELDRSVIEEIGDPLMHLLRNAIDHGVEPPEERLRLGKPAKGTVTLEAFHEENHIIISVRDDGRGVDPDKVRASAVRKGLISEESARRLPDNEAVNLIWTPGFSTAEKVSDISGRGVGLDVVHKNIEKLNGSVEIRSEIGQGTEFRVKLPLTLAIIRALQVEVLGTIYCIPLGSVVETDRIPTAEIQTLRQRAVIVKRGEVIPLLRLVDAFGLERPADYEEPEEVFVVIVAVFGKQIGLVVDNLIGEGDVVIKPLGKFIGDIPGISGATIMGDGNVAIILDISSLVNSVQAEQNRLEAALS